jgi:hypothetical protein
VAESPTTEAATREQRFERAWNLLYLRLFKGIDILVESAQWWPAAALCMVAIDVFADTTTDDGDADAETYAAFLREDAALSEYGEFAERFYASLRCGLIHRMVPKARRGSDDEPDDVDGPAALGAGSMPPRLVGDHLVVDVPHLVASVRRSFENFKASKFGPRHSRFIERMVQTVYEETPDGLISQS